MIRKLCLAAVLALASGFAAAETVVYQGSLGIPNVGYAEYSQTSTSPNVYGGVIRAQQKFMSTLKAAIAPPIVAMLQTVDGYQAGSGSASVSGPVTFALNNGVASFSGLQLNAGLTVKQSKFGITATCSIQVRNNPGTTVTGTVDPVAGTFTITGVQNFTLSSSYSCSTNVDWVPVVNIVVDTLITRLADQVLAQKTQEAYNSLNSIGSLQPIHFAGIDSIPDGALLFNGVDYGAQVRSRLANLFNKASFSVTIGDPKHYITGPKGYAHLAYSSDLILSFTIDEFRFQLLDRRTYVDEVFCPSTSTYCYFF
jgi:hypothetical protein